MTLKAEYYTKISDYDLNLKQKVFYILNRDKFISEAFAEKIIIPTKYQTGKDVPLDSKIAWRISPNITN